GLLALNHGVDPFFDGAAADKLVYQDVAFLADAEGAIGRLVLDSGVPPAIEMNDVASRREVESAAAGFERDDEKRRTLLVLKSAYKVGPLLDRCAAVKYQPGPAEHLGQKVGQRLRQRLELREDQHLL